ncbi:hypothetical protein M413DRAFT_438896 [Hebeloma cylindrosporum]|uniref:Uncharacterized protein n=1 Tax=Hebeloma cylindrosporum TaxID=76867 RepID=A0A0C3CM35_HEBCY|nr:hypothetical protein M413DRAFT_438896 [Hebeloma cylindrosporum h7]
MDPSRPCPSDPLCVSWKLKLRRLGTFCLGGGEPMSNLDSFLSKEYRRSVAHGHTGFRRNFTTRMRMSRQSIVLLLAPPRGKC